MPVRVVKKSARDRSWGWGLGASCLRRAKASAERSASPQPRAPSPNRRSMLGIDFETVRFARAEYLWLLIVPGVLLVGWVWQLAARRRDARRYRQHRRLPVRERFPIFGSLVFWLCLILASACLI